eukprot:CAMPEP_0202475062 /NCGR_PEP_ID=MMETSP1360-20130828/92705_1 /ASSEMBLY_ACC=CAM_ASM_000848 /TAXON_ID=515479 /ORGANISM="Licmophora paradoxa, Strain CCMP2313" /LENGTH=172 /DNA_ID=CAMNT_0049102207 /DNA_START=577 /DNA_END=1092 /DNA_ORIENTATION=-
MKWSARADRSLSRKVFYQTLFYMLSCYGTVPWQHLAQYNRREWQGYSMMIGTAIVVPLQGLLNLIVYCTREKTVLSRFFLRLCPFCRQSNNNFQRNEQQGSTELWFNKTPPPPSGDFGGISTNAHLSLDAGSGDGSRICGDLSAIGLATNIANCHEQPEDYLDPLNDLPLSD